MMARNARDRDSQPKGAGMETIEALETRRSCRQYLAKQVDPDILAKILEAGTYAPSGMGRQPEKLVVLQSPEDIKALSAMNAKIMGVTSDPFYGAPTVVVVLVDPTAPTCVEDGALVMGNLMNAAHALGVDSCWIHRAHEEFESDEGKALLAKWGVGGEWRGVGHCILGYADGAAAKAKPRKDDAIVYVR